MFKFLALIASTAFATTIKTETATATQWYAIEKSHGGVYGYMCNGEKCCNAYECWASSE